MSEITVTLKADGAPWVVIHGDTPEDTEMLLDAASAMTPKIIEAAMNFRSAGAAVSPARGGNGGGGGGQQRQQYAAPAAGGVVIQVPFADSQGREAVKAAGGRWNGDKKGWTVTAEVAAQFPQYRQI